MLFGFGVVKDFGWGVFRDIVEFVDFDGRVDLWEFCVDDLIGSLLGNCFWNFKGIEGDIGDEKFEVVLEKIEEDVWLEVVLV